MPDSDFTVKTCIICTPFFFKTRRQKILTALLTLSVQMTLMFFLTSVASIVTIIALTRLKPLTKPLSSSHQTPAYIAISEFSS